MKLSTEKLGLNIHLAGMRHFGLDEKKTIETLFSLPYQHVRIPIPMDEIALQKGKWNFEKRDWLLEQAAKHKKSIHLQVGAKTIGWPEVWLPQWIKDANPYLDKPHTQIDSALAVREFLLEAIEKIGERYFSLPNLQSIQVENEAFCRRLPVSNFRYISFSFHKQEQAVVKKLNKNNALLLQNLPLNHPLDLAQSLSYVLKESDIVGLNIYNQHIPYGPFQTANNVYLSSITRLLKPLTALQQKQFYVTEIQSAAWLLGNNTPLKPFSEKIFEKTLKQYVGLGASVIFLWDVEQIMWRNKQEHNHNRSLHFLEK